jgi:dihydrofolate reductase
VITHEPPDPEITFVSEGIEQAIAAARDAAGRRDVGILGANTAQQAVAAGLVDELVIHVVPRLLGGGVRLFGPELQRVRLERLYVGQSGDATDFRFRVRR